MIEEEINEIVDFVPLKSNEGWEILNIEPHTIRRVKDKFTPKESTKVDGYIRLHLDSADCYKHRLIAEQFVSNPNNYNAVDHIDVNRTNNEITNLRGVSSLQNNRNLGEHNKQFENEIVEEIDDESVKVLEYGKRKFEDGIYYFHEDTFFKFNGMKYEKLHVCKTSGGSKAVYVRDENNKKVTLLYSKFKKQYNLI
jgi:hypothetical protein